MLFVHENNLKNKIATNYKNKKEELKEFYENVYLEVKRKLLEIEFVDDNDDNFKKAAEIINNYYNELDKFSAKHKITSQSKFRSTFLEEISTYLFVDNKYIKEEQLGIYNRKIYEGIKIGNNLKVSIIKKDVDFCIGKKVHMTIENKKYEIILPIIAVEVKTYLDATMFGEVQFSSRLLKNATPSVKAYILMETNRVALDKVRATRNDTVLEEMFVLRLNVSSPIDYKVLKAYYLQISNDIKDISIEKEIKIPGRLINID